MADTNMPNEGVNSSIAQYIESMSLDVEGTLKSIDLTLRAIARKDGLLISQSSLQDLVAAEQQAEQESQKRAERNSTDRRGAYAERNQRNIGNNNNNARGNAQSQQQNNRNAQNNQNRKYARGQSDFDSLNKRKKSNTFDDALDSFEKSFTKGLFGKENPVSQVLKSSLQGLADKLDTDMDGLGKAVGSRLGKMASDRFFQSWFGRRLKREWQSMADGFGRSASNFIDRFGDRLSEVKVDDEVDKAVDQEGRARAAQQENTEEAARQYTRRRPDFNEQDIIDAEFREVSPEPPRPVSDAEDIANSSQTEVEEQVRRNYPEADVVNRAEEVISNVDRSINSSLSEIADNIDTLHNMIQEGLTRIIELLQGESASASADDADTHDVVDQIIRADAAENVTTENTALSTYVEGLANANESIAEITEAMSEAADSLTRGTSRTGTALTRVTRSTTNALSTVTESTGTALVNAADTTSTALDIVGQGATTASTAFPLLTMGILAADAAAGIFVSQFKSALEPVQQGFADFTKGFLGAANRTYTQTKENLTNWQKRAQADVESIVRAEFDIIEDAAKKVTSVWDSIVTTVTATQGYDKAGVQDLWANYAQRLTDEGLANVVSSADIMEKLNSVLEKGLSGQVAEEFAYIATILGNAIPTEDFFSYAETYASIAANAIKQGASQEEAIAKANDEIKSFASNLVYASRELAGGFSTSLTNAAELFEDSAKIAMTSTMAGNQSDISDISGVLTAISAAVGAIAPDLASSLVTTVTSLATGGNSSELTALRSLAGVGASNSAFLKELSKDPKKIFANMFGKLAELQNMSTENFMEVSEGLASVFGMSMDAFARVDFAYLADAIDSMDLNNRSFEDMKELLVSGQTTSTESQLRMQKINEYMVEEGLAYVLDNEVARSIQEHMWEEQLADQITQSTFAVELVGGTASLFNGISTTISKIVDIINPVSWVKKINSISDTNAEYDYQRLEIEDILNYGKVGKGNADAQYNLLHGNTDLGLTEDYLELISKGQASRSNYVNQIRTITTNDGTELKIMNGQIIPQGFEELYEYKYGNNETPQVFINFAEQVKDQAYTALQEYADTLSTQGTFGQFAAAVINNAHAKEEEQNTLIDKMFNIGYDMLDNAADKVAETNPLMGKMVDSITSSIIAASKAARAAKDEVDRTVNSAYKWSTVGKGAYQQQIALAEQAAADFYVRNSESGIWKSREDALNEASQARQAAASTLFTAMEDSMQKYVSAGIADTNAAELAGAVKESTVDAINAASSFAADTMTYTTKLIQDSNGQMVQAVTQQHRDFYTQSELMQKIAEDTAQRAQDDTLISFDDWVAKFEADWNKQQGTTVTGYRKIADILEDYGADISLLERAYSEQETAQTSAATRARDLHEVQFWEDMQQFATKDFPWYMREWERYYIQHEAYGEVTAQAYGTDSDYSANTKTTSKSIGALFSAEQDQEGDAVLALAKVLTDNSMWQQDLGNKLKEPTLQTNAILAKILLVVEAIMQQNNETSIVSVPTSLSSLGLGVSNL